MSWSVREIAPEDLDVDKIIDSIVVDKANFEHIAQTGKISGNLRAALWGIIQAKINEAQSYLRELNDEAWRDHPEDL